MSDWADWIEWRAKNPRPSEPSQEPMGMEFPRGRAVDANLPRSSGSTLREDLERALLFLESLHMTTAETMHFELRPVIVTARHVETVHYAADRLAQLGPPEEHHETPEDPRQRALRLRQTRNTGPSRPAAQNAHRPRKAR